MPLKKPLAPVVPQLVRNIPRSFAWIDHRLRTRQFLADFDPEEFALYLFLSSTIKSSKQPPAGGN